MALQLRGVFTALATPFSLDGSSVDWVSYERLILRQIAAGVAGIVPVREYWVALCNGSVLAQMLPNRSNHAIPPPTHLRTKNHPSQCGTTGESPTLTKDEKHRAISEAVRLTRGTGVLVVAGTGSNNTADSVEATAWAKGAGADAALVVNPYYNRPTQAGLLAHIGAVAAVGLPVLLYNIPGRSGVALTPASLAAAAAIPGVVGVKDATGGLDTSMDLSLLAPRLAVLSGDDAPTLAFCALGGTGVVSVVSNLFPEAVVALVDAALKGDLVTARARHVALLPVAKAAFIETNPAPIKAALAAQGIFTYATLRLPLVEMAPENKDKWLAAVNGFLNKE
jgi:4-hydroxy-tetrahydrodipicolinate synthase